jgi:putative ABC transport system permease protein
MREIVDIPLWSLALGYLLALIPLSLVLFYRVGLARDIVTALLRMTVQLLFVGFYLQVVFRADRWWLTTLWLVVMMAVADLSVLRGAGLRLRRFFMPLLAALAAGTLVPLSYFILVILGIPDLLEPQYVIPIGGMIMGNCLRANIIGIGRFYRSIKEREGAFHHALGQGATLREAVRPFFSRALRDALAPAVATMMTIGLVTLPGMMTGIIMAGIAPQAAIKYQIAIMLAIFSGAAITVAGGIELSLRPAFTPFGTLRADVFKDEKTASRR